jgi:hypothetical protein
MLLALDKIHTSCSVSKDYYCSTKIVLKSTKCISQGDNNPNEYEK